MSLFYNKAMKSRTVHDIMLYITDSSIEEACKIIEDLGRGNDELYLHNDVMSGAYTIWEIAASYDGSLLAQMCDGICFEGGPNRKGWYDGDLQKVLYDRVLYAITEFGPSSVAGSVGLNYSL